MADSNQNIVEFRLTGTLSTSGTTVNVSNDIHRDSAIAVTDASVTLENEQGTVFELVKCTIAAGVLTTSKRGLTQAQTLTEDSALKREWRPGTRGFVTSFASDSLDREGDTMTGALSFSGTTNSGIRTSNLTTAQRLALTPANGMIVYDTTLGEHYQYIAGAWSAMASGSVQPNASPTVAGKGEVSTTAQSISATDTGETGALMWVLPSDIAKNTQSGTFVYGTDTGGDDTYVVALTPVLAAYTAGQRLTFTPTTANTGACSVDFGPGVKNIKTKDGNDPQTGVIRANSVVTVKYDGTTMVLTDEDFATATNKGIAEMATDAEAKAKTDAERYVNPSQLAFIAPNNQAIQTYAFSALPTSFSIAHGLGVAPTSVKVRTMSDRNGTIAGTPHEISIGSYKSGSYSTLYATITSANPPTFLSYGVSNSTISQHTSEHSGTTDDLSYSMTISSIDATNINFAITRTLGATVSGNVWFLVEYVL